MIEIETNVFRITNLRDLSSTYRTYRVVNLHKDQEEYHKNCQLLTRKLSFMLRSPAAVIERKGEPILVVNQEAPQPPNELFVFRTQVVLEPLEDQICLDYTVRTTENDAICLRFLSFLVQNPLRSHASLWQPGSGKAFFDRQPYESGDELNLFRGYSVRPILTSAGDIGLCVDVQSKLVLKRPLPARMDRQAFQQRFKGKHCIYHFGTQWYEIQLTEFSALNASQYKFPMNGNKISLYDYIMSQCAAPLPKEIASLSRDSSVVVYSDNRDDSRGAAAALCFLVIGTDDEIAQSEFPSLSIPPGLRRRLVHSFVETHLKRLRFAKSELRVDPQPVRTRAKLFQIPDFEFGCATILSTRATPGAVQVSLDELGAKRLSLLKDKNVGFYVSTPLDNFYMLLPQSVEETFGPAFRKDLSATVDDLFPQENGFTPQLVIYPDRDARTFSETTASIFAKAAAECKRGGYAVVMIPEFKRRRPREEDTSAAYIIQQLKERFDLRASIIHKTVGGRSYVRTADKDGKTIYSPHPKAERRLNGYLRNVAINKVLLLNRKWPFVLATPLHADVVVGIDVKGNMAGFIATNKRGDIIIPFQRKSQQKEKLMPGQCSDYFVEVMTNLIAQDNSPIRDIVIHRDGRLFDTEMDGLKAGLQRLKDSELVGPEAELAFVEIPQTSPAALRLFDISQTGDGDPRVQNPQVGNHYSLSTTEGFVCTTGRAFRHGGTAKPLHVIKKEGPMSLEYCLEDVFCLSCLAWTRPEDCSRDPITTKLNDRWLGEEGAQTKEENETDEVAEETET